MMKTKFVASLVAVLLLFAGSARADILIFKLGTVFSSDTPFGIAPWLKATFNDGGGTGVVTLTMESLLQDANEFVDGSKGWYFNFSPGLGLDPGSDPDLLGGDFALFSGPAPTVEVSENSLMADGDGNFDFRFEWGSQTFGMGVTTVITITHTGITVADFDFLSFSGGGQGDFFSAAHIKGTAGPQNSGWIGTPIPAPGAFLLGAMGLSLVGWLKRRVA